MAIALIMTVYFNIHSSFWSLVGNLLAAAIQFVIIAGIYQAFKKRSEPCKSSSHELSEENLKSKIKTEKQQKSQKRSYNCPNCGQILNHPGTCMGRCSGDGRGVFRMD